MAGANPEAMAGGRFKRKGSINEDDVSHILHRYTATTILMLLQEVYQAVSSVSRIDWKNLVRRTGTGITSPREYQMLWRHLAYRKDFLDRIEDGSEPLDIDSDLEFELEADPKPSEEILSESSNCVKLLLNASSNTDIPTPHNNIATNELATRVAAEKHTTVRTHRITVDQKSTQPNPLGSAAEVPDAANPAAPPKKKRKQWTKEEDSELVTAVQKLGENWSKIEAELKSERTPHQLQLRWNLIKKKQAVNQKPEVKSAPASWEERKAAQETFSLAVGAFSIRPGANPTNGPAPQANQGLIQPSPIREPKPTNQGLIQPSPLPEVKPSPKPLHPANPIQPHHLNPPLNPAQIIRPQKTTLLPKSAGPTPRPSGPPAGITPRPNVPPAGVTPRPNGTPAVTAVKPNGPSPAGLTTPRPNGPSGPCPARSSLPSPCSSIQAAAFAAGGRIANPSTAASLLKAAQSKNVVHIRSTRVSVSSNMPVVMAHSHTTIGVRGPGVGNGLGTSFGIGSVVEVDKHGFIEAKKDVVVVKGSGNGGKEIIGSKVETVLNGNGNGNKEESKEKVSL